MTTGVTTPAASTVPADPAPSPAVRCVDGDGGVVLMHVETGKYFALTPVAEKIWNRLGRGEDVEALGAALVAEYGIDETRARRDVERLLASLADRGLVVEGSRAAGSATPSAELFDVPPAEAPAQPPAGDVAPSPLRTLEVAVAWWALAAADLRLARGGYAALRCSVAAVGTPARARIAADAATAARWHRRLDTAARAYVRRAWCLQRSAALVHLLRRRGVAAQLVIGVRRVPFGAHAWVEVGGTVVNDDPRRCAHYRVIDRC